MRKAIFVFFLLVLVCVPIITTGLYAASFITFMRLLSIAGIYAVVITALIICMVYTYTANKMQRYSEVEGYLDDEMYDAGI